MILQVVGTQAVRVINGKGSHTASVAGQKDGIAASATFSSPRALLSLGDAVIITEVAWHSPRRLAVTIALPNGWIG